MAKSKYVSSLTNVLVHEGGYVNHPADPGGATNKGVTQRVYDLFRKAKKLAGRSVKHLTDGELKEIYKTRYWDAVKGDQLPPGIDYVVFDGAVNSGPGQAIKWVQRALGSAYTGKIDGQLGPSTLAAIKQHTNHDALVAAILRRREAFLRALKTFKTFGKGWMRRIKQVLDVGQAWAAGDIGPEVEYVPDGEAKAKIEDRVEAPSTAPGDAAAGGGTAAGGTAAAIEAAKSQLEPLAGDSNVIGYVVAGLVVAGLVVTVGGLAWRWHAKRKAAHLTDVLDLGPA